MAEDPWVKLAARFGSGTAVVGAPSEGAVLPTPALVPADETSPIEDASFEPVVEVPSAPAAVGATTSGQERQTMGMSPLSALSPEALAQLLELAAPQQEHHAPAIAGAQQVTAVDSMKAPSQIATEPEPFQRLPELVDPEDDAPPAKKGKAKKSRRERRRGKDQSASEEPQGPPQTAKWTGGNKLLSHGFTTVMVVAMMAGPAALVLSLMNATEEAPAAVTETREVQWDAATLAGERGRELVAAWLAATRSDGTRLSTLYLGTLSTLPEVGQEAQDVAVAQVRAAGEGLWTVLVGADVEVAQPTEQDPEASAWVRQFFQVPVAVAETDAGLGVQLLALPAPMPAPAAAEGLSTTYRDRIATTSPVGESITGFMNALLAGAGDLSRYTTPGTALAAITPTPYDGAEVQSIEAARADVDVESPEQGARMDVLVDVALVRADGQKTLTSYALQLTARDARWEISAVADTPTIAADSAAVNTEIPANGPGQNATSNTTGAIDGGTE